MTSYKKILFDLDGTILNMDGKMSNKVEASLKSSKDKISISFCTGRPLDFTIALAQQLGITSNHIVDDGSRVVDYKGKELWSVVFPQKVIDYYVDLAKVNDFKITATVNGKNKMKIDKNDSHISRLFPCFLNQRQVDILIKNNFSPNYETKIVWYDPKYGYNVSITDIKGNKKHGIRFLLNLEDLKKEEVIGVGDGINDLPLFESVGYQIAMGNASSIIKSQVGLVAPSINEDGVAWILNKLS